jgi:hypothetical protein
MNFYYDPILGLQYNLLPGFFTINIDVFQKLDAEYLIKFIEETGVFPTESFPGKGVEYIFEITNYRL